MFALAAPVAAQQGEGIFFSVFGSDAPKTYGDTDNRQAFYFEIPAGEAKPMYLRIFDASTSGRYEERHNDFNTRTKFTLLGSESANMLYISTPSDSTGQGDSSTVLADSNVIYQRIFGNESSFDRSYISLGPIPMAEGYLTEDGYRRFVLVVEGLEGDDGNYFDLLLSYDPAAKEIPETTRSFVYDLTLRIPDEPDFLGKIFVETQGNSRLNISTFDIDSVPLSVEMPLSSNEALQPSGDGTWQTSTYVVNNPAKTQQIGVKVNGRDFNNSFGLVVRDEDGNPMPIPLPIKDYRPSTKPVLSKSFQYVEDNCRVIDFSASLSNAGSFNPSQFLWKFPDDTLQGAAIRRSFQSPGYKTYTLSVEGVLQGSTVSMDLMDSVYVNSPPEAWTGGDRVHVPGKPMAFDGTVSVDPDGFIEEYYWDFGDSTTGRGARIDHTYQNPGSFTLTLRVVDNSETPCNTDSAFANITINQPPVPVLNVPDFVEEGETFTLDATQSSDPDGQITEYRWDIGSDTTLFGPQVTYRYSENQSSIITLTVKDDADVENSTVRRQFNIDLNRLPVAVAKADKYVAAGVPVTLDATGSYDPDGTLTNYKWTIESTNYTTPSATHVFETPGFYTAKVQITDDSGESTAVDSVQIRVNAPPNPVVTGDYIYATGFVTLSADSSYDPDGAITDYLWSMGDGTKISGNSVDYTYDQPGSYTVELSVTDNSGTSTARANTTQNVIINHFPVAEINAPEIVSPGASVALNGSESADLDGEIISYSWDLGDGTIANGIQTTHRYQHPGVYQIQLKVRDDSGLEQAVGFDHHELRVNHPPVIKINYPSKLAPSASVTLDASASYDPDGTIGQYIWYLDGKEWRTGTPTVQLTPKQKSLPLSLVLVDDANVQNSRVEKNISLATNSQPLAKIEMTKNSNGNIHTVQFDATTSIDEDGDKIAYFWDFGDGNTARGPLVAHTYTEGGTYRVTLRVDDQQNLANSLDTASTLLSINRPPVAQFSMPPAICQLDTVTYDAQASFDPDTTDQLSYNWQFGDGSKASGPVARHSYSQPNTYLVSLTASDNNQLSNSTNRVNKSIRVIGNIIADAGENQQVCETSFISFDASKSTYPGSEIEKYQWDFGDGTVGRGMAPTHRYTEPGTYQVTLTVSGQQYGSCAFQSTDKMTVTVNPRPEARFDLPQYVVEGETLALDPSPSLTHGADYKTIHWYIAGVDTVIWEQDASKSNPGGSAAASGQGRWSLVTGDVADQSFNTKTQLPISRLQLPKGEHQIKLFVETTSNSVGCTTALSAKPLEVVPQRKISFSTLPDSELMPGQRALFSIGNLPDNIDDFKSLTWNMGDGTIKKGTEVFYQYEKAGTYKLQFTALDGRGLSGSSIAIDTTIVVNEEPSAAISGPELLSSGTEAIFTATHSSKRDPASITYQWSLPDGTTRSGQTVSYQFDEPGWYTIRLSLTDNNKRLNVKAFEEHIVQVVGPPAISEDMPERVCPGQPVNIAAGFFTESIYANKISIQVDDKRIEANRLQDYRFSAPGKYTITAAPASDTSSTASSLPSKIQFQPLVHEITVVQRPEIKLQHQDTVMIGAANDYAYFDASESIGSQSQRLRFYWNMGDGTQMRGKTIMHQYKSPGSYNVTLTVRDNSGLECGTAKQTTTLQAISY